MLIELAKLTIEATISTGYTEDCLQSVMDTVEEETRAAEAVGGFGLAHTRIALKATATVVACLAAGVACAAGQRKSKDGTTAVKTAAGTTISKVDASKAAAYLATALGNDTSFTTLVTASAAVASRNARPNLIL